MIGNKWYIVDEFSKYSHEYDNYAFIQKRAAIKLADFIQERLNADDERNSFFEIGCGTGLFTIELLKRFPESAFHISDISSEMISLSVSKIQTRYPGQFQFEVLDGENLHIEFRSNATSVVSAFTMQWFENPAESINQLFERIPTCKRLFVSFLAGGSFPEWKYFSQLAGVPFTANALPTEESFESSLAKYGFETSSKALWMNQVYPNSLAFLNSLKHIGAGHNINDDLMSPAQLRRLLRTWDAECEFGVEVRHKVIFMEIKKGV